MGKALTFIGTLALVGSGEYLPPMADVDKVLLAGLADHRLADDRLADDRLADDRLADHRLANDRLANDRLANHRFGKLRLVCLPTAAGEEGLERIRYWSELGVTHFTRLGVEAQTVPVVDRQTAEDKSLADLIRSANFVYLSGGHPAYLYKTLEGTPAWEAITQVLAGGGVVAGCSAGAMIFAERILGFRNFQLSQEGFNFLPGTVILPHFDEFPAAAAGLARQALSANLVLLGIEGNTALAVSGESARVLGRGGVTVWKKHSKKRLTVNDPAVDLAAITCPD